MELLITFYYSASSLRHCVSLTAEASRTLRSQVRLFHPNEERIRAEQALRSAWRATPALYRSLERHVADMTRSVNMVYLVLRTK